MWVCLCLVSVVVGLFGDLFVSEFEVLFSSLFVGTGWLGTGLVGKFVCQSVYPLGFITTHHC